MTDNTIVGVTHQIDTQLADNQRRIEALTVTIGQLRGEIDRIKAEDQTKLDAQAADWKKLNEHLNKYADEEGLCGAYEDKIDAWNSTFNQFTLVGRRKSHVVTVKIQLEFVTEIEVDAIDKEAAKEKVYDMDTSDILSGLYLNDYEDSEWSATQVREGHL